MIMPFSGWVFLKTCKMANPWFRFKQFLVRQEKSAFKVGTDGVLLGAWADTDGVNTVLDIGTGTGLLALMLAQRTKAKIMAIEIDRASYQQASENIKNSPWTDRINVQHCSIQDFSSEGKFDLIITNPPFFQDSLRPEEEGRSKSRHNTMLSLDELAGSAIRHMHGESKFSLVLPVEESSDFEHIASGVGLFLHRILHIRPTPAHPVKRHLMEYRLYPTKKVHSEELIVEKGERHDYTPEYRNLTKEFYLKY